MRRLGAKGLFGPELFEQIRDILDLGNSLSKA
jgi:hypothetical protein